MDLAKKLLVTEESPQRFPFSASLYRAYAYRVCTNTSDWAEKADYSECLNLISHIPSHEVSQK